MRFVPALLVRVVRDGWRWRSWRRRWRASRRGCRRRRIRNVHKRGGNRIVHGETAGASPLATADRSVVFGEAVADPDCRPGTRAARTAEERGSLLLLPERDPRVRAHVSCVRGLRRYVRLLRMPRSGCRRGTRAGDRAARRMRDLGIGGSHDDQPRCANELRGDERARSRFLFGGGGVCRLSEQSTDAVDVAIRHGLMPVRVDEP